MQLGGLNSVGFGNGIRKTGSGQQTQVFGILSDLMIYNSGTCRFRRSPDIRWPFELIGWEISVTQLFSVCGTLV